jgi:hypothetical protein
MIFECQKALNALDVHAAPYNANYVGGLYSEYTYSDDDFFPEAKGNLGKSSGSSSGDSAITGGGYIVNSDSDFIVEFGIVAPYLLKKARLLC